MFEEVSSNRCHGGWQRVIRHHSTRLGCPMRVGVFLPPAAASRACPVLYFLSGLTCTEQNVITKGGAQRWCAEHGIVLVTPDTSPRGDDVADDAAWDLGQGAGFYLSATQPPWASSFHMDAYVTEELPQLVRSFTDNERRSVTGHSMGGHGAVVLALRNPGMFDSVSAFAPILTPSAVPWGRKAFSAYLGPDEATWAEWDATALVARAPIPTPILIDQGSADDFLQNQLPSEPFLAAARAAGQAVEYRLQEGYDHSYYFVSTFMEAHVAHHARALNRG
ncbi:MAG: S-formylglutathione hydrolase [Myxococcales bacterium]|nr:S-formylglutathione hydrolase [Myxococcales bacterium]